MNPRRRGRELALQALFQLDVQGDAFIEELAGFLNQSTDPDEQEVRAFARRLTEGAWQCRAQVDALLNKMAVRWSVDRMAVADRNILRMGIYQLLHCPDIPPRVVINEAIELGKRYSTAESAHFINGLLDAVNKQQGSRVGAQGSDKQGPASQPPTPEPRPPTPDPR